MDSARLIVPIARFPPWILLAVGVNLLNLRQTGNFNIYFLLFPPNVYYLESGKNKFGGGGNGPHDFYRGCLPLPFYKKNSVFSSLTQISAAYFEFFEFPIKFDFKMLHKYNKTTNATTWMLRTIYNYLFAIYML